MISRTTPDGMPATSAVMWPARLDRTEQVAGGGLVNRDEERRAEAAGPPPEPGSVTNVCDIGVFDQRGIEVDGPRGLNRLPG